MLHLLPSSQLPKVSLQVLKEDILAGFLPVPGLYQVLKFPVVTRTPAANIAGPKTSTSGWPYSVRTKSILWVKMDFLKMVNMVSSVVVMMMVTMDSVRTSSASLQCPHLMGIN